MKPKMPTATFLRNARKENHEPAGTILTHTTPAGDLANHLHALGLHRGDAYPAMKGDPSRFNLITRKDLTWTRHELGLSRSQLAEILEIDEARVVRWLKPGKDPEDRLPIEKLEFNRKISQWKNAAPQPRMRGRNRLEQIRALERSMKRSETIGQQ